MREDIIGRANVEDDGDLAAYYAKLGQHDAYALWTVANAIEPWKPEPASVPTCWKWSEMRPFVLQSLDLVTPEKAGRRVVALENPGKRGTSACVGWLYTGLQGMRPGESTSAHRHAAAALRFIMEGRGAYTIVDGQHVSLNAGDFVITPGDCWHEHGVEAEGETSIWQDGLDMLLVNQLDANFYAVHPDIRQSVPSVQNDSPAIFGGVALRPSGIRWSKSYSPLLRYGWEDSYNALQRYASVSDGTRLDGVTLDYTNPLTGGPVMPTMGAQLRLLRPAEHTKARRVVGSQVFNVAKGSGTSVINGQHIEWQKNDIFVVPSWAAHEHINASASEDAVLFSFHDFPVMRSLGLYREEAVEDALTY